ncbi:hypothetical protein SteCoe_23736 [Stentor coeruleus]|uniref:Uncharacterized protein n=1 Tax=Stentor coeruleus TaxID=5963 RepID=A0A1R2BJ80_9CILI|nr:hypothetical protein SteCoe_23736 [Stentor coeruleus]
MLNQSILSSILLRETGENFNYQVFSNRQYFFGNKKMTRKCISVYAGPRYNSTSQVIWIGGKENILVTLNSHGQVVVYDLLNDNKSTLLNENNENLLKIFFAGENLFMVSKSNYDNCLYFYLISIESLQNGSFSRTRIFHQLLVHPRNLNFLDSETCVIIVENGNQIQIWDILSDSMFKELPLDENIHYHFTSGHFIFWEVAKSETKLGIISLKSLSLNQIIIKSTNQIKTCEIVNSYLLLEMKNCMLQILNINTGVSHIFNYSIPLDIYKNDSGDKMIVRFTDNTFTVIGNNIVESTEKLGLIGEVYYADLGECLILSDKTGKIYIIDDRVVQTFEDSLEDVQQIGVNHDTNHIYLACRGKILIVE